MFEPVRGGTRGGQAEFKWSDVSADKDREHYLGHSINAPTGRWQKNKDVHWYNRDNKDTDDERTAEVRRVKQLEADALAVALGFEPAPQNSSEGPSTSVEPRKSDPDEEEALQRAKEKEEKRRRKAERKEEKAAKKQAKLERKARERGEDSDDYYRRSRRDRSRSRSPRPRKSSRSPHGRPSDSRHSERRPGGDYDAEEREREREKDCQRWDLYSRRRDLPASRR